MNLDQPILQSEFAALIGVSEASVSAWVARGSLERGQTAQQWLLAYCAALREQAAGRASGEIGGLDLVQERAALAREQRVGYEIKNAVARGEYAPIAALASVLATASQAVVDRFEMLPGQIKKVCPDLPDAVRTQIDTTLAEARNEWVASTASLVVEKIKAAELDDDDELAAAIEAGEG